MRKKETPTAPPAQKVVLSTREAAAYLSISLPTLFRLTRGGELAHLRIGRALRYRVEDLEDFLASRATTEWKDYKKPEAAAVDTETAKK